ncbi:MAG: type II secretion system protein N [Spongiibacteraceae bacterium]|jgi:hypothetical protein
MKWLLSIVVVLVLLLVAIAFAPASLVPLALVELDARGMLQANAPRLTLAETRGSVWRGEAAQATLHIEKIDVPLGVMTWKLQPLSLLNKEPVIHVTTKKLGQTVNAVVTITEAGQVSINDLEGRLPLTLLEPWAPMLVRGDIAFMVDHIVFTQQQLLAIDGAVNFEQLDWLGAGEPMPLGSYLAQVSMRQDSIQVQLNDFGAKLGLVGELTINPAGSYQFKGTFQPREGLAPQIAASLKWFGKVSPNGDIAIDQKGRF